MKKYWCIDPECRGKMRRLYRRKLENGKTIWSGTEYWMCDICGTILREEALKKWDSKKIK